MARQIKTRPVTMSQVREYLARAEEFLLAATSELEAERSIAAASLAIHAGINAADAVCGARLKKRAAGHEHRETIKLLGQAGDDGSQLANDLQRLLPMKTKTECEPDEVPLSKATTAVERAKRCVPVINQMDANEEIFKLILADDRMRELFVEFIGRSVYDQIRAG